MITLPQETRRVRNWCLAGAILLAAIFSSLAAVVAQEPLPPPLLEEPPPNPFGLQSAPVVVDWTTRMKQESEAIQKQLQQSLADIRKKEAADPSAALLRKLRTERRDTLRLLANEAREDYQAGKGTLVGLLEVSAALQASELELLEKHAERLAVLQRFVKFAEQIEQAAQRRVSAGKGPRSELLRAKAYGLSVQEQHEQERNRRRLPPEQLKVLSDLVEARKSTFLKVKALSAQGAEGGESDKLAQAGAKLRLAQAELAFAEGRHEDGLSYTLGACVYAGGAVEAFEDLFELGATTIDFVLEAQSRFAEARLRLLRAYRVFGTEGKSIPLPKEVIAVRPDPESRAQAIAEP